MAALQGLFAAFLALCQSLLRCFSLRVAHFMRYRDDPKTAVEFASEIWKQKGSCDCIFFSPSCCFTLALFLLLFLGLATGRVLFISEWLTRLGLPDYIPLFDRVGLRYVDDLTVKSTICLYSFISF